MEFILFSVICLAYSAVMLSWPLFEKKRTAPRQWVMLILNGVGLPIAFFAGQFTANFEANLCYSGVIGRLLNRGSTEVGILTLSGYETSCESITSELNKFLPSDLE